MSNDLPGRCERLAADAAQLCEDYRAQPEHVLLARGHSLLHLAEELLDQHPSYQQHRRILTASGWAGLLLACLEHDQGRPQVADATCCEAAALGQSLHDPLITAWSWEIKAWIALASGDAATALDACRAGLAAGGQTGVSAQLHAQAAAAHAYLGAADAAAHEIRTALQVISAGSGDPSGPGHFHVDVQRIRLHAMGVWRQLGDQSQTLAAAQAVVEASTTSTGDVCAPMPYSQAMLAIAEIFAQRGQCSDALDSAETALRAQRRSLPSLLPLAHAVSRTLHHRPDHDQRRLAALDEHISSMQCPPRDFPQ